MQWFARVHNFPHKESKVELVVYRAEQRQAGKLNAETLQLERVLNREFPNSKLRVRRRNLFKQHLVQE